MATITKRVILDPSSGVMDAILKGIVDADTSGGGGTPGTGGGGTSSGVIISATTPGNPTAGMQWWNGSILRVYDGTTWQTIGPSAAAGPVPTTTKVFAQGNTATMSLPAAAWTIVPYVSTPTIDTQQGWDGITRMFRPTKPGIYFFMHRLPVSTTTGAIGLAILKNDTGTFSTNDEYVAVTTEASGASSSGWLNTSGMAVMNGTTDFVRAWSYSSSGGGVISGSNQQFANYYLLP